VLLRMGKHGFNSRSVRRPEDFVREVVWHREAKAYALLRCDRTRSRLSASRIVEDELTDSDNVVVELEVAGLFDLVELFVRDLRVAGLHRTTTSETDGVSPTVMRPHVRATLVARGCCRTRAAPR
jgi:hypothetical protein